MILKWYGTASLSIETISSSVLFDPFIPLKGSKVDITAEDYKKYTDIFITHAHPDHVGSLSAVLSSMDKNLYGTKAVKDALTKFGINYEGFYQISPGDKISIGDIGITVIKGKHIHFDLKLVAGTLFSKDMIKYLYNIPILSKLNRICKENSETVAYLIEAEGKRIFLMGSLNLDSDTEYPVNADLLVLPYQGSSDLVSPALVIVEKLRPKRILLDHFDNTFPPVSKEIDTSQIQSMLSGTIDVIKPDYRKEIIIGF